MSASIVPGTLKKMYEQTNKFDQLNHPVLQVIKIQKISSGDNRSTKYRITLTDGKYFTKASVNIQLNKMFENGEIKTNSIIEISEFIVNPTYDRKILIITKLNPINCNDFKPICDVTRLTNVQNSQSYFELTQNNNNDNNDNFSSIINSQESPKNNDKHKYNTQLPVSNSKPIDTAKYSILYTNYSQRTNNDTYISNDRFSFGSSQDSSRVPSQVVERENQTQLMKKNNIKYISINVLNPYLFNWKIKVRVVLRSKIIHFANQKGEGKLFSVILKDSLGSEISGTFFNDEVDRFDSLIIQDHVYSISGGIIKYKSRRSYTTNSDYEITFDKTTIVKNEDDDGKIGNLTYNFCPLNSIGNLKKDTHVDVICYVISIEPISEILSNKAQKTFHKRTIVVCDDSNVKCEVSLWGEDADNFPNEGNFFVAFKDAIISDYYKRSLICNSIYRINPNIPEVSLLKEWIKTIKGNFDKLQSISVNYFDSMVLLSQINTENIGTRERADYVNMFVTFTDINAQRKLFYQACPNPSCHFKGLVMQGTNYYCERCTSLITEPKARYNFSVKIQDHTGSSYVSIIGDDAVGSLFIGMNAEDWANETQDHDDENYIRHKLIPRFFTPLRIRCRYKMDTYQDQGRVKGTIVSASPLSYKESALFYAKEIRKYFK